MTGNNQSYAKQPAKTPVLSKSKGRKGAPPDRHVNARSNRT